MDNSTSKRSKPRRRVRLAMIVGTLLVLPMTLAIFAYAYLTDSDRIRLQAVEYLQEYFVAPVTVREAHFSWSEGIQLFDVVVAGRSSPDAGSSSEVLDSPLISCSEFRLRHDPWSLVFGDFKIKRIEAVRPAASVVYFNDRNTTNWAELFRPFTGRTTLGNMTELPIVELREARVRVTSIDADRAETIEDLCLTIRAMPLENSQGLYDIVWHSEEAPIAEGHSQFDLESGRLRNVQGGLPWMSIDAVLLAINAGYDGVTAWQNLLGLAGTVRAQDYDLSGSGDTSTASVTIALTGASISIPINSEERLIDPMDRYLRFEGVEGFAQLTDDSIHADFSGVFHGSSCRVTATFRLDGPKLESLADVAFDAQIKIDALTVPRPGSTAPGEARFFAGLPALARFYRDYDPIGVADLEIDVVKAAGGSGAIAVRHALITARGGKANCRFFPYALDDVVGVVEFGPDGIFVRDIRGVHGDAHVVVEAWVSAPKRGAEKWVSVRGTNVALDDAFWNALAERYRPIRERFSPEGVVDFAMYLSRPDGTEDTPEAREIKTTVSLRGISAKYEGFPYALNDLTGDVVISRDGVRLSGLAGKSGDGRVAIDGKLSYRERRLSDIDLAIHAQRIALDDALMAALPARAQSKLLAQHATGYVDVRTTLSFDAERHKVLATSDVLLDDVSAVPAGFPVPVTGLLGKIRINERGTLLDGVTGRYGGGTFSVDGLVDGTPGGYATFLTVRSQGITLDDPIRSALPPRFQNLIADWTIEGAISSETVLTGPSPQAGERSAGDTTFNADTIVRLNGGTMSNPSFPLAFEKVSAELRLDGSTISGDDLRAKYGSAVLQASVRGSSEPNAESISVSLNGTGLALDDTLRGCLPEHVQVLWDRIKPSGTADLRFEEVRFERRDGESDSAWSVRGYVELNDVELKGLAGARHIRGKLVGGGKLSDFDGSTSLTGGLDVATIELLDRKVSNVQANWSFARASGGDGVLALDSLTGHTYAGSLTGRVALDFQDGEATYETSATVHGMQLSGFVNATTTSDSPGEFVDVHGDVDGQLYFSGVVGDTSSRRGGGRFEVLGGQIYRAPIILAILNVLNFAVPGDEAFDEVRASFLISGDVVDFSEVVAKSQSVALVGTGSMSLPDFGLDLGLINVNPNQWARFPGWKKFAETASREIVQLHVTGPLSRPAVRVVPFRGVTDELRELFSKPMNPRGRPRAGKR